MTAVPFIMWWLASSAEAVDPSTGGAVVGPGEAVVHGEVGMAAVLPTVQIGGTAGLSERVDLSAHYVTHAGLAHAVALRTRVRATDRLSLGLQVDESFFTVEELAGIQAVRVPVGNRLALTPQLLIHRPTADGVHLGWTAGAALRTLAVVETPGGTLRRAWQPAVDEVWAEVAAEWPGDRGNTTLRFRAIVPVATELHVLGYLPVVALGRTWGLP